MFFDN